MKILYDKDVDRTLWNEIVMSSQTGTWFQTPEAYDFFSTMPELFVPFCVAIAENLSKYIYNLRGVCVGYITIEKNPIKQFFTRRAIILGGPALANDITNDEVEILMKNVHAHLSRNGTPIFIETRNFNDYSRWKDSFKKAGFKYQPHLNFHVHTNQAWENIEDNIGKHRKKYIRLSFRDGATIEEKPTIEQIRAYYDILLELYRTKVKMPLQPYIFFEKLFHCKNCKYLLVLYNGEIVGGSICMLLPSHGLYEWYACGKDGLYKNIHPSSVTKYAGMKYACDNGYAVFDMMGAGKPDEEYGVRDFKAEFGGELVEHGRFLCVIKPYLYKLGSLGVKVLKRIKG